eukprot:NODE_2546_length_2191_cov_10.487888.p1 GENE.NODE_2546_length_2191_cov_10.487888~~NODE_2546_length_2191_cov_10.487888.p1  ORF type:complete len:688 (-),score=163.81 NODE_2546_length_2191_cov_10.487888:126-2012(-)
MARPVQAYATAAPRIVQGSPSPQVIYAAPPQAATAPAVSTYATAPVTYAAPAGPVTYAAPAGPVTYAAPAAPVTYAAPTALVTYAAPTAPVTYAAPAAPVTYAAPTSPVTYAAPTSPVTYAAPSTFMASPMTYPQSPTAMPYVSAATSPPMVYQASPQPQVRPTQTYTTAPQVVTRSVMPSYRAPASPYVQVQAGAMPYVQAAAGQYMAQEPAAQVQQSPQPMVAAQQQQQIMPQVLAQVPVNDICDKIQQALMDEQRYRDVCTELFQKVAGTECLDLQGLITFKVHFEAAYGLPSIPVKDFQDAFDRFDFDGNGAIDLHEAIKLVRQHLFAWRKALGGADEMPVEFKTPEQGGYTLIKVLASGGQGTASLYKDSMGECVIKSYSKHNANAGGIDELRAEMVAMQTVGGHPGIAQCYEIFQDQEFLYMSSSVNSGGDLTSLKSKAFEQGVHMGERWWKRMFYQSFSALAYMHGKALMHCDIKEPNLMIQNTDLRWPHVVIIDLGMASAMAGEDRGLCGTPGYIPPETWSEGKWFPRGDVFSMGVVMVQLLTNTVPNEEMQVQGIFQEGCMSMEDLETATLTRQPSFEALEIQDDRFVMLCVQCLAKERRDRLKAPQALQNSWLAGGSV